MPKKPVRGLDPGEQRHFNLDEIEDSEKISQDQLNNAKIFSSREEYAKTLPKNIRYMEIGVAWGYSVDLVVEASNPVSMDLLDRYDQDLKCWSWRKFGECKCDVKHQLLYTPDTHEQYIINKYSNLNNVTTVKGDALDTLKKINKEFDYIYIDIVNDRKTIRECLSLAHPLVPVGGIIGMNDYLIYDGIIEDVPYGTFQTVNEFLYLNKNWVVDALALHNLGFYDIYLRRVS